MKKTMLALTVMTILTTGCFPALLIGGGVAAGTALAADSRSLQTISDDTNIQHQAIEKLKAAPEFGDNSDVTVTSFNYIVLLTGQVLSDALRVKAEQIVQSIPRIRRVYNMLKVAPTTGLIQGMDDTTISANIKARMAVTSDLNSNHFKYIVENKVVYLMGYTSHSQAKLALEVIRNSAGVTKVVNLVEYNDDDDSGNSIKASNTATPTSAA